VTVGDGMETKFIKVRVNASGKRLIGIISIPPPHFRVSDYLNSHDDFLRIKQEKTEMVVAKDAISYLEALEEGEDAGSRPRSGQFHKVTVTLKHQAGTLRGEFFVPENSTLKASLNKIRRFVNLREVKFVSSPEHYGFLAVGKQEIIMIQEATEQG
jgi:hypothetical protein